MDSHILKVKITKAFDMVYRGFLEDVLKASIFGVMDLMDP